MGTKVWGLTIFQRLFEKPKFVYSTFKFKPIDKSKTISMIDNLHPKCSCEKNDLSTKDLSL